ncbi:hypothetical protein [Leptolyngbya sp. O-77]|uniref:hypothetical protein n=1 Tax=Leptolyngbya sp. O-77 TaxID=1080068 RepID=UPI00074D2BB7|nr:hypothetical protein [Leptolyngbya sp. O-77]BAU44735.1 hypothetical protein O77CONTIG1_04580 [Leptolyngbya sp. O-77]
MWPKLIWKKPAAQPDPFPTDSDFQAEVERLHQHWMNMRWRWLRLLWLAVVPLSLWHLRDEIALWRQYFTWTAVRYGLIYHPLAATGLILCASLTVSTLLWQSCTLLFGIPTDYRRRLSECVLEIRQRGPRHPLWRRVCQSLQPTPSATSLLSQHPPHDQPRPQRRKRAP